MTLAAMNTYEDSACTYKNKITTFQLA